MLYFDGPSRLTLSMSTYSTKSNLKHNLVYQYSTYALMRVSWHEVAKLLIVSGISKMDCQNKVLQIWTPIHKHKQCFCRLQTMTLNLSDTRGAYNFLFHSDHSSTVFKCVQVSDPPLALAQSERHALAHCHNLPLGPSPLASLESY